MKKVKEDIRHPATDPGNTEKHDQITPEEVECLRELKAWGSRIDVLLDELLNMIPKNEIN